MGRRAPLKAMITHALLLVDMEQGEEVRKATSTTTYFTPRTPEHSGERNRCVTNVSGAECPTGNPFLLVEPELAACVASCLLGVAFAPGLIVHSQHAQH